MLTFNVGEDIFNCIKDVFVEENMSFEKLSAITTDGAPAMVSENVGVIGHFRKLGINFQNLHCAIHQFNLAIKKIGLESTMSTVTKIVNKLKGKTI